MKFTLTSVLLFCGLFLSAQLPTTDLYMFTMLNNGERISLKNPVYLSGFNPDGYNNQPYFNTPSEVYITTDLYDDNFTDFIKLDLQNEVYYRITATDSISEYSPTPRAIPGYFSSIRVEKDGKTQSLWLYPNSHKNDGKRVLEDISTIGYHCWLSDEEVAMFLVGEPMKLAVGNIESNTTSILLDDIGRCFRQDSNGNLIFVHKASPDRWYIKSLDPETRKIDMITQTVPGSEDFELLSDGTFIMGKGSMLYSMNPSRNDKWAKIIDLTEYGILNINRLATSRNRLILVNNPKTN